MNTERGQISVLEMDYLRCERISKLKNKKNKSFEVRKNMKADEPVLDWIEKIGLKWFGHPKAMKEEQWTKRIFEWISLADRRHDRPRMS